MKKFQKKIQKKIAKIAVILATFIGYCLRKIIATSFGNWLSGKGFQFLSVLIAIICTALAFFLWAVARAVKKYGGRKKFKKSNGHSKRNYDKKWKKIRAVADAYLEEFQEKNIGKSLIDAIIKWLNN